MQSRYLTWLLAGSLVLAACGGHSADPGRPAPSPANDPSSSATAPPTQQATTTSFLPTEPRANTSSVPPGTVRDEDAIRADDIQSRWTAAASRHGIDWIGLRWSELPPTTLSTEIPDWAQEYADENNIEYAVSEERGGILVLQFDPDPVATSGASVLRATTSGDDRLVTSIQLENLLYSGDPEAAGIIAAGWRVLLQTVDPDLSNEAVEAALIALDVDRLSQIAEQPEANTTLFAEWTDKAKCTAVYIVQTVVLSCELN